MFLKKIKEKRINKILDNIDHKHLFQRYLLLAIGCFISAFAFNVFFSQYGIVCFGVSGLSLIFKKIGINPATFILIANIFLLVISYIFLGKQKTKHAIVGSLMLPVFVYLTEYLVPYIKFENAELLVIALFGGILSGIGYGLIYKTNFNTGGTDIITEIVSKYTKVSLGKATWVSDGLVVLSGLLVSPLENVLYGFLIIYLISFMTDKVVLGISQSKAFYIVTEKELEVKEFLLSITNGGVTIINARGGYSNEKQSLLLGVVPTRQYFIVKEGLREIDKNIFFLACDAYEVSSRSR
jgi:uncharacterized membrane-anchored protein YitT (DUF2179 family)